MKDWMIDFAEFAGEELPAESAERLIGLLRPAIRLSAAEDGEIVVGRLGGLPKLPDDMAWPSLADGCRPMSFLAELDCGELARYEVDIALPGTGTLLFFATTDARRSQVIYVPHGIAVAERPAPDDHATVYAELPLAAVTEPSWPERDHPALVDVFGSLEEAEERVWHHVLDEGRTPARPSTSSSRCLKTGEGTGRRTRWAATRTGSRARSRPWRRMPPAPAGTAIRPGPPAVTVPGSPGRSRIAPSGVRCGRGRRRSSPSGCREAA
ncbi:DUF1963 domain-containing protein [Microbispora siamensis]